MKLKPKQEPKEAKKKSELRETAATGLLKEN